MIDSLLTPTFAAKHVTALLKHYSAMMTEFQQGAWEETIGKSGKFCEAVLKALWIHTGNGLPPGREFKAGKIINQLPGLSAFDDTIRLTIPRAVQFAYDIASNRGARHDSDLDPNEMDATAVVGIASWILGEMVRFAQKGNLDHAAAKELIDGLSEKKYQIFEEVEGRRYVHVPDAGARDIALLLLWQQHPSRIPRDELEAAVARHGFTKNTAAVGVTRLRGVVDIDSRGLRLLQNGLQEADRLFEAAQKQPANPKPRRHLRRRKGTKRRQTRVTDRTLIERDVSDVGR